MEGVNLRQNGIDGGLNPGGGGGSAEGAVSYMVNQYLNDTEKNRARNNIGAARASGEEPDLVAGDIMPKSNTPQVITNQFAAQTTGGDADLKSGSAQLLNIKGSLDANLNPFLADSLVSTGMNLVNPEQTLVIGGRKAYYFPVVRGNWGSYGTTNENNGFIIIGGDIYEVYFNATKPTAQSYGSVCPKTTYDGQNYYLPSSTG